MLGDLFYDQKSHDYNYLLLHLQTLKGSINVNLCEVKESLHGVRAHKEFMKQPGR